MTPASQIAAGPAKLLLDAFCLLAEGDSGSPPAGREAVPGWFAGERYPVDCARHPGRFDAPEIRNWKLQPPSIRAASLGVAGAREHADGGVILSLRLAAAVVSDESPLEKWGDRGRRLAERVCFELARPQEDSGRQDLWPLLAFGADALGGDYPGGPRGCDIGSPREIRAASVYDKGGKISIWAVTWLQEFLARPEDFALPAIEAGEIPETVKSGFAPEVGTGHESDYEQVAPAENWHERERRAAGFPGGPEPSAPEIPPRSGEVVRMTIQPGDSDAIWYSRFAGQEIGSAEGDAAINQNIAVERVMWIGGLFRLHGLPGYRDVDEAHTYEQYFSDGGPGESKAAFLAFEGLDAPIVLPVGERTALLGGLNLALRADLAEVAADDAWAAELDRVSAEGLEVSLVIADAPEEGE